MVCTVGEVTETLEIARAYTCPADVALAPNTVHEETMCPAAGRKTSALESHRDVRHVVKTLMFLFLK